MNEMNRAVIFDKRDCMPPKKEDDKDLKIKELELLVRSLKAQLAHLQWVTGAFTV
jgi:hypothetical protein